MPWLKTANVAMYKGANWDSYIKTVPKCSPQQARRIALLDPNISFFFFCREYMVLENPAWPASRVFNSGDAVFFRGAPWYGSAPQCDAYQKNGMSIAYINAIPDAAMLSGAGCYTTDDGGPAVDVVCCIDDAFINQTLPSYCTPLAPEIPILLGGSIACARTEFITKVLKSDAIQGLQAKGITVLLTFLNNHDDAGWSEFTTPAFAQNFVDQLKSVVETYGLDGIDIDDEFAGDGAKPVLNSLAMVTSMMKQCLPGKIISKALFADAEYFGVPYQGVTLEQTLTYGWEMSYGGAPQDRLPFYANAGMAKNALSLGFLSGDGTSSPHPIQDVDWLKKNGYEGVMVYAFEVAANSSLLGTLVNAWCGPGNWNQTPNCP